MHRFLKQSFFLIALTLLCGGLSAWLHPKAPPIQKTSDPWAVSLYEISGWEDAPVWVDARSEEEYRQGHIPGAIPLNQTQWDSQVGALLMKWMPGKRVVVYCSTLACNESHDVAKRLRESFQLEHTYHLEGGWDAWQEAQQ